jgi:hypothetical protein
LWVARYSTVHDADAAQIEAVNLMENNQFSLHAKEGCTLAPNTSTPYTGTQIYTDCNYVFNVPPPPCVSLQRKC